MFHLVNDIEAYPQYMEGCVGVEILTRSEALVEARLDLQFTLNNRVLGAAAGKLFESVTLKLVDGLSRRARDLYG